MIAVLIMVFQESGFGVIRYLEYAYRLPESCKRDPEYVRQMDNVLNGHLRHTAGFLTVDRPCHDDCSWIPQRFA